ncbi:MAG: hypothetical protein OEW75_13790 [Cyclobacteriaceae bacterium]|nr:hypothetical protein [Cyclobacteriaceae bacterium]
MEQEKYLNDLSEIRSIMNKSSRFLSLSGLSGILAGIYALIGAAVAYRIIYTASVIPYTSIRTGQTSQEVVFLFIDAFLVLVLSLLTGFQLSKRKAEKNGVKLWDHTAKRVVENLAIPLATGGFLILILIYRELYFIISPITLIFYGLALVNASKYTLGDVKYLGLFEIAIGLTAALFPGKGLYFWALGFGVMHIIYGGIMYFKYDK